MDSNQFGEYSRKPLTRGAEIRVFIQQYADYDVSALSGHVVWRRGLLIPQLLGYLPQQSHLHLYHDLPRGCL